jgi:hypothetical protein
VRDTPEHFLCNREAFEKRFAAARLVRTDTDRLDLFAAHELEKMLAAEGKRVSTPGQRPDLAVSLFPVDRSGRIDFGPADVPLGTLRFYDPALGSGERALLWVETFDGQEDRPWPSVAVDLIRAFRKDALGR